MAGRTTFHNPEDVVERTDLRFRQFAYHAAGKCHQHVESALVQIPDLNLISGVVLDSMHMVYLGVMRRILYTSKGKIAGIRRSKLSEGQINRINKQLASCHGKLPSEFNRQPR